jgi:hypothetical protein
VENPLEPKIRDIAPPGDDAAKAPPPITRLRTYKDDIADAVKDNNMSAAKIFLAEEERRQQRQRVEETTSPETPKNRFIIALSVFLVIAAVSGFAYFRFFYRPVAPVEMTVEVPPFVRIDRIVEIPAADRSYRDVQTDLRRAVSAAVPSREIHQVALSESREADGTEDSPNAQIPAERMFGAIGAYPPDTVTRAVSPNFFIGVYGSSKGPLPFIIFETASPSLARAAMLEWEETMAADLAPIFPKADGYVRTTANQPILRSPWGDAVYQNRDARVLSAGDEEVLLWGFGDNGAIIIASDPFLLPEMAARLTRDRELH